MDKITMLRAEQSRAEQSRAEQSLGRIISSVCQAFFESGWRKCHS